MVEHDSDLTRSRGFAEQRGIKHWANLDNITLPLSGSAAPSAVAVESDGGGL